MFTSVVSESGIEGDGDDVVHSEIVKVISIVMKQKAEAAFESEGTSKQVSSIQIEDGIVHCLVVPDAAL